VLDFLAILEYNRILQFVSSQISQMAQRSQGGNMQLEMIREIIQKTHNGSGIKSFNLLSGEKITSPEYTIKEIKDDGSIIFLQKGCRAEDRSDSEIATEAAMVASITYFP